MRDNARAYKFGSIRHKCRDGFGNSERRTSRSGDSCPSRSATAPTCDVAVSRGRESKTSMSLTATKRKGKVSSGLTMVGPIHTGQCVRCSLI